MSGTIKLYIIFSVILSLTYTSHISVSLDATSDLDKGSTIKKEYSNPVIGLNITNDRSWSLSPNSTPDKNCKYCIIVLENKNNPSMTMSVLAKNLSYFDENCDCNSLIDFIQVQYVNKFSSKDIVAINDSQTKLPRGISGWQMEYTTSEGNKHYTLWFIMNNIFYEINFESNINNYSKYLNQVKPVINSLEFFKPDIQNDKIKTESQIYTSPSPSFTNLTMIDNEFFNGDSNFTIDKEVEVLIVKSASFLTDTAYQPNPIEIKEGQTVKWINKDTAFHTVTSGSIGSADAGEEFDSGLTGPTALITQGKSFEHTFDNPGEFDYHCTLHPNMMGKVIVAKPILFNMP